MSEPRFALESRPGPFPRRVLLDRQAQSRAEVAPGRGGMATRLAVAGRELLYLDEETFLDPAKNVRGGNPVLFPTPGKLEGDAWRHAGRQGALKQHGFARNAAWEVVRESTEGRAEVVLALASGPQPRADWPWRFRCELGYALAGPALRIDIRVRNEDATPMPFGFGFHPYFQVAQAQKAGTRVETRATRAWDNKDKREVELRGIDLTLAEVDLHLRDHGSAESALSGPAGEVRLRGSPEFTQWVVWTLAGKDFVCLESWTCPGNALNTGERLLTLAPGEERALWLEISG